MKRRAPIAVIMMETMPTTIVLSNIPVAAMDGIGVF